MTPFVRHRGVAAPLLRDHIDTDVIIPKQYLKSVRRTGFGPNLFDDWRYLAPGGPGDDHAARPKNPEFVLNRPRYAGASILVAGANFGCGSSREHAVWAFLDAGFRAVIAPGFADIFDTNAAKCGLLTVRLEPAEVRALAAEIEAAEGLRLAVDLPAQTVTSDGGAAYSFAIDPQRKRRLLEGLDDIALTLEHTAEIRAFETARRERAPWLFDRFGNGPCPGS